MKAALFCLLTVNTGRSAVRIPITILKLRKWAAAKPPHEIIGYAGDCLDCPIANYLHDIGCVDVSVNLPAMTYTDPEGLEHRRYPGRTIVDVIRNVDHVNHWRGPITATDLLNALDKVQPRLD